jgi:hypothetical protein
MQTNHVGFLDAGPRQSRTPSSVDDWISSRLKNSLIGMVMVQGKQREVVNIGLGIKQVAGKPRDVTVSQYVESLSHKECGPRPRFLVVLFLRVCFTTTRLLQLHFALSLSLSLSLSLFLGHRVNAPSSKKHS